MKRWLKPIVGVFLAIPVLSWYGTHLIDQVSAARNGSGTYSVPHSATAGAIITASDWNANFTDVGTEITNSLPRDGQAGMTGQFQASSGTAAAPSISFTSDPDTGFYRSGANQVTFAAGGVDQFTMSSTGISAMPVGAVLPYAGESPPTGFLFMYGQCVSQTTYANLYAIVGSDYSSGCAGGEFGIPDLRGRVVAGQDDMNASGGAGTSANRLTNVAQPSGGSLDGDVLGATGGAETHTLLTAELAAHTHGAGTYSCSNCLASASGSDNIADTGSGTTTISGVSNSTQTVSGSSGSAGSGTAHDIVQPTIILNYIIKY